MRFPSRRNLLALVCLGVAVRGAPAADAPVNPLRLVPREADIVVTVDAPRKLVETVIGFEPLQKLYQLDAVREQLDSTANRRFQQLLAYYEKALGAPWPDLLDRLAGGGIVLASKFQRGEPKPPFLAVVQAKDEALLRRTFGLVQKVIEQELVRQDSKERPTPGSYRGLDTVSVGNDLHAALAGSALVVSNRADALHKALDLHINGSADSLLNVAGPTEAKKSLPPEPLAWVWVNLAPAHQAPEAKDLFHYPKTDPNVLILFGGIADVVGHAPFLAVGLHRQDDGFLTTFRMPKGRDSTPEGLGLHLPPAGQPGSLPLLEPKNVLYSDSFYLDVGRFWTERERLLGPQARKLIDEAEKQAGRFLAGRKLSELLLGVGPYHRVVAAAQIKSGYKVEPQQRIPAFAVVSSLRDKDFANAMDAILRTVALFVGSPAKLKLIEERVGGATLVGYRFPENGSLPNDDANFRFNFSPCFASVGDQFFAASTLELGREMVQLLQKPAAESADRGRAASTRKEFLAEGGVALLQAFEDQLLTQTVLDRGVPIDRARTEVAAFLTWLRSLGAVRLEAVYGDSDFRYDIRLDFGDAAAKRR